MFSQVNSSFRFFSENRQLSEVILIAIYNGFFTFQKSDSFSFQTGVRIRTLPCSPVHCRPDCLFIRADVCLYLCWRACLYSDQPRRFARARGNGAKAAVDSCSQSSWWHGFTEHVSDHCQCRGVCAEAVMSVVWVIATAGVCELSCL